MDGRALGSLAEIGCCRQDCMAREVRDGVVMVGGDQMSELSGGSKWYRRRQAAGTVVCF